MKQLQENKWVRWWKVSDVASGQPQQFCCCGRDASSALTMKVKVSFRICIWVRLTLELELYLSNYFFFNHTMWLSTAALTADADENEIVKKIQNKSQKQFTSCENCREYACRMILKWVTLLCWELSPHYKCLHPNIPPSLSVNNSSI